MEEGRGERGEGEEEKKAVQARMLKKVEEAAGRTFMQLGSVFGLQRQLTDSS